MIPGGGLALAERALAHGDALDAAAQLRVLLDAASSEARPYLEIQLARSYVALDRLDDAETILRRAVDLGTASAWPAVFELAAFLVRERGADPLVTWQALASSAEPLRVELGRHILQFASSPELQAKLGLYAPRPPPPPLPPPPALGMAVPRFACIVELDAYEANPPHDLPSWRLCPVQLSPRGRGGRSDAVKRQLLQIASAAESFQLVIWGNFPDEDRWLLEAHQLAEVVALAPHEPSAQVASWLAMIAYQNAANVAAQSNGTWTVSRDYRKFARSHVDHLHPDYRAHVRSIADSFLRVAP